MLSVGRCVRGTGGETGARFRQQRPVRESRSAMQQPFTAQKLQPAPRTRHKAKRRPSLPHLEFVLRFCVLDLLAEKRALRQRFEIDDVRLRPEQSLRSTGPNEANDHRVHVFRHPAAPAQPFPRTSLTVRNWPPASFRAHEQARADNWGQSPIPTSENNC